MSKVALLLSCLLLGACKNEMEVDPQINTVDEIMQCVGLQSTCELLTNEVVEKLPLELQDKIVDTSDRIVIYTGDNKTFTNGTPVLILAFLAIHRPFISLYWEMSKLCMSANAKPV